MYERHCCCRRNGAPGRQRGDGGIARSPRPIVQVNVHACRSSELSLPPFCPPRTGEVSRSGGTEREWQDYFLDVVSFLGRLVADGPQEAIRERSPNPRDLLFGRQGKGFELAVQAAIPRNRFPEVASEYSQIRYEVRVAIDETTAEASIESEMLRRGGVGCGERRMVRICPG